jgi:hypothetical protein
MEEAREHASEDRSVLNLGCLFLFSGICFLDPKNLFVPGFLRISLFSVFFRRNFSQGRGFGGVLKILFSAAFT